MESGPSGSATAAGAAEGSATDIGCGERQGGRIGAGGGQEVVVPAGRCACVRWCVALASFVVHVRVLPLRCSAICFFKGNSLHMGTISFNTLFNT
jgi:hypothetical protein